METVGQVFFQMCLPIPPLENGSPLKPPPSAARTCPKEPKLEGICPCFQQGQWTCVVDEAAPPQAQLFQEMRHAYNLLPCPAARQWLQSIVDNLARKIHARASSWGDMRWHKSADAVLGGTAKARRVDYHVKQWCVQGQSAAAATRSLEGAHRNTAPKVIAEEMAAYQATLRLTFSKPTSPFARKSKALVLVIIYFRSNSA